MAEREINTITFCSVTVAERKRVWDSNCMLQIFRSQTWLTSQRLQLNGGTCGRGAGMA